MSDVQDRIRSAERKMKALADFYGMKGVPLTTMSRALDALRDALEQNEALRSSLSTAMSTNERWQTNSRDTFDAMCAMRNDLNQLLPMPSLESDLLQGPENSVFFATVVSAVAQALSNARSEGIREGLELAAKVADGLDPNADDIAAAIRAKIEETRALAEHEEAGR